MNVLRVRITMVVADLLDVIMSAPADNPVWGLRICEQTGHGSGTVYPALDRLLKGGWIADRWESPAPTDRPRRRFYSITAAGREEYATALASRASRRTAWTRAQVPASDTHD
jgi:PadR family transcriptional regulator, regulatory protein PadR